MSEDQTIYVKVVYCFHPTDMDKDGCDGIYLKESETLHGIEADLVNQVTQLQRKLAIAEQLMAYIVGPSIAYNTPKQVLRIYDMVWKAQDEMKKLSTFHTTEVEK